MDDLYQLLRYYIPGSLSLLYVLCLTVVNLDAKAFLSLQSALLPSVLGGFAISPVIGYIVYSFYDWLIYNPIIAKSEKRPVKHLLKTWAKDTSFEDKLKSWENLKEFIDFALYSNEKEARFKIENEVLETIRGFWSHINARLVSSIFVPIFSCLVFLVLWFAVTFFKLPVLNIPPSWSSFNIGWTVATLLLIVAFSVLIGLRAVGTIREAFALEEYVILAKRKFILKYMGYVRAQSLQVEE